jgi:tRNA1Val (adenine37-N6)-methyltransferase
MKRDESTSGTPRLSGDIDVRKPAAGDEFTVDTLLRGRVTLLQPVRGFRSSLDPVLLAAFAGGPTGRFLDIGCGTGALAFLLAAADPHATGVGVEIQARLASLATAGLARNTFADRVEILHADIRGAVGRPQLVRASFDLVAANPPYRVLSAGMPSPDPERARANHEISLTLDDCLDAASTLVNPRGRVVMVYPAERLPDLLSGMQRRRLTPTRLRPVRPREDRPASRVLVEARFDANPAALVHELPLVLHERKSGGYTPEVMGMLGEQSPSGGPAASGRPAI